MAHPGPIDVQTHYVPPAQLAAIEGRTELPRMIDGPNGKMVEYGPGAAYPVLRSRVLSSGRLFNPSEAGFTVRLDADAFLVEPPQQKGRVAAAPFNRGEQQLMGAGQIAVDAIAVQVA